MNSVQIDQKSYEMPPREGMSIAHFLTVADIQRSAHYYEKVFGARILSLGDGNAPGYLQLANIWMILNVGGGVTPRRLPQIRICPGGRPQGRSLPGPKSASHPGRALTVGEGSALSDLDDVAVRIADVAAYLAVLGNRLRDELGPSTFP